MPTARAAFWQTPEANQSKAFPKPEKVLPAYTGVGRGVRTLAADCFTSFSLKTNCFSAKTWLRWSWPSLTAAVQVRNREGSWAASRDRHEWAPHSGSPVLQDTLLAVIPRSQCSISCLPAKLVPDSNRAMLVSSCCSTTSWQFRMPHQIAKTFCN